jgi:hypothetical protein
MPFASMAVATKKCVVKIVDEPIGRPAKEVHLPQWQQLPLQDHDIRWTRLPQGPQSCEPTCPKGNHLQRPAALGQVPAERLDPISRTNVSGLLDQGHDVHGAIAHGKQSAEEEKGGGS